MNLGYSLNSEVFLGTMHSKSVRETAKLLTALRIGDEGYLRRLQEECVSKWSSIGEDAVFAVLEAAYQLGFCELSGGFGELCEELIKE